ncbi:biotin--[acetyl-CoA-carboxylase] ligase [Streptomyces lienomycini]
MFPTPSVGCMTPRDSSDSPNDAPHSRWSDLDRPPLNGTALRRGLVREGGLWRQVDVVQRTGSTNSDLVARAAEGDLAEGVVLVAEEQSAARGRLDRRWTAPPRSGLFFSVLLRPAEVPVTRWGWLPLLTGVAVATGLSRVAGVDTALKWPNDLLVTVGGEERKAGGILAERAGTDGVVIGVGINVSLRADELPVPRAGSLALAGATGTDRDPLLRGVLRSLEDWYGRWRAADGDPAASGLQETYAAGCATLGRMVRAELPGDRSLVGEAVAVDGDGRLVLATEAGVQEPVGAGDIVHLRLA